MRWIAAILSLMPSIVLAAEDKKVPMMAEVPSFQLLQVFLVLAGIIGFIFLLAYLYQKLNSFALKKNPDLKVITGLSLGTRERIVVIEVGKQQILVGITQGAMRTLHVLEEPLQGATAASSSFAEHLKNRLQGGVAE